MKTPPTPTSPKYKAAQEAGPKIWTPGELQKPWPFPFGRVLLVALLVSLAMSSAVLAGVAWAIQRYPHSWITRWVPTSSTTVVEKTSTASSSKVPSAVSQAARTLYGLVVDQSDNGVYLPGHVTGLSVPISNNGWLVTLGDAIPAGETSLAVLPALGQPQAVSLQVTDPATPFIFLKTDGLNQSPATISPIAQAGDDGTAVWVVSQVLQQTTVVARRLVPATATTWRSSDRQEHSWQLDQPTTLPAGSGVLDQDGHFVGLLGENSRVWPLQTVAPALKQLVRSGTIDRPWLGLTYVDRSEATITGQPAAAGLLIGGPSGTTPVAVKSPAEKAGLKSGDLILTVDGQPVSGDLFTTLLRFHPGDTMSMTYERLGKKKDVSIKLGVLRP